MYVKCVPSPLIYLLGLQQSTGIWQPPFSQVRMVCQLCQTGACYRPAMLRCFSKPAATPLPNGQLPSRHQHKTFRNSSSLHPITSSYVYRTKTGSQTEQQLALTDVSVCALYQSPFFTGWIEKIQDIIPTVILLITSFNSCLVALSTYH